ncbi:hypothetical protein [Streptomyces sp. ISL-112]|uniref:DUF7134 domain-containing protein n=1 Tax=Streptomyces sp. ISL-112 TaxID=2819176 RepID=UPI0027E4CB4F|nr:hypothetical protein [Streptomyces sp. ISL-112]
MTFDRLAARVRARRSRIWRWWVCFTASDVAVDDPGYRQDDALTWALLAVSLAALVFRRRRPVPVACVTGAACAGWAVHGHIGELLNLPVIVALYTVAVLGDRRELMAAEVTPRGAGGSTARTPPPGRLAASYGIPRRRVDEVLDSSARTAPGSRPPCG